MVKFIAKDKEGKNLLGLGLSEKNLEKLKKGLPIVISPTDIGNEPINNVFIFYGATEKVMHEMLEKEGFMGPNTKVNIDPKAI